MTGVPACSEVESLEDALKHPFWILLDTSGVLNPAKSTQRVDPSTQSCEASQIGNDGDQVAQQSRTGCGWLRWWVESGALKHSECIKSKNFACPKMALLTTSIAFMLYFYNLCNLIFFKMT